jgi:O-antigen/teichoic acid export membrane protein
MRYVMAVVVVLGIALGVAAVVYGEADDSPGLQLIGVLLAVASVALVVRALRRRHS